MIISRNFEEAGMLGNIIVSVIIAAAVILGVRSIRKRAVSGCCGGGDAVAKVKVSDHNLSHYPYDVLMQVDGMHCANCARRVENALNSLEGVFAAVDLGRNEVSIRMKERIPDEKLKAAVRKAGYSARDIEEQGR